MKNFVRFALGLGVVLTQTRTTMADECTDAIATTLGELSSSLPKLEGRITRTNAKELRQSIDSQPLSMFFKDRQQFPRELAMFRKYFDASLRSRRLEGEPVPQDFEAWMEKRMPSVIPQLLEEAAEGQSFEAFRFKMQALYWNDRLAAKPGISVARIFNNPVVVMGLLGAGAVHVASKTVDFTLDVVGKAFVTGPIASIASAAADPFAGPLSNAVRQWSNSVASTPSKALQNALNSMTNSQRAALTSDKNELKRLIAELELVKNEPTMKREELLSRAEKLYTDIFQRTQAFLSSNMQSARLSYAESQVKKGAEFAMYASVFYQEGVGHDTNLRVRQMEIQSARTRLEALKAARHPSPEQTTERQELERTLPQLETDRAKLAKLTARSKERLAASLVAWRQYELIYREQMEPRDADGKIIRNDYQRYRDWLNPDEYGVGVRDMMQVLMAELASYVDVPPAADRPSARATPSTPLPTTPPARTSSTPWQSPGSSSLVK